MIELAASVCTTFYFYFKKAKNNELAINQIKNVFINLNVLSS